MMTNKKLILGIITFILIIVVIAIYYSYIQKPVSTVTEINDNIIDEVCAKEGETIGAQGMPKVCCSGLKPVGGWPGGYQGDCSIPPPPTGLSICTNCGNGICNIDTRENKCNCPKDCK